MQVLVWVGWLLKFGRPKLFKTHTPMELPQGLRSTSSIWYPEGCLKKHHQPQNQADQESQFLRVHRLSGNRLRRRQRQRGLGFGLRVVLATLGPDGRTNTAEGSSTASPASARCEHQQQGVKGKRRDPGDPIRIHPRRDGCRAHKVSCSLSIYLRKLVSVLMSSEPYRLHRGNPFHRSTHPFLDIVCCPKIGGSYR